MSVPSIEATPTVLVAPRAPVSAPLPAANNPPPPLQAPTPPEIQAVNAALQAAVVRQGGLAPLMADLAQALETPGLPQSVQEAGAQLMALQTPVDPPPGAADLQQALVQSGLMLEAGLAAGQMTPDLKSALLVLGKALQAWLSDEAAASDDEDAAPPANPQAIVQPPAPPPPFRGAPTSAQPAVMSSLSGLAPEAMANHLLQQTGAALARTQLLQIASLPEQAKGPSWTFEVPILTPQGTAVAQFQVSRDKREGAHGGREGAPPVWRAGFSIDVHPMGPIHAQVVLSAGRALVSLWAERQAAADQLRQDGTALAAALGEAGFSSNLAIHTGAPARPRLEPGRFLDQAS